MSSFFLGGGGGACLTHFTALAFRTLSMPNAINLFVVSVLQELLEIHIALTVERMR